jgi:hypothetical protein
MPKRIAIMQPTFYPWSGYFNLIAESNQFIFLDDVQLEKQSWQTRNRYIINGTVQWISIPIRTERLSQKISETKIVDFHRWSKKFIASFKQNYGKHPQFKEAYEVIDYVLGFSELNLAEFNINIIKFVAEKINLKTEFLKTSDLIIPGERTERLVNICDYFNADEYLSPTGSKDYLERDGFVKLSKCKLRYQSYVPGPYPQKGTSEFVSHLSILDIVANIGWRAFQNYIGNEKA